MSQFSYCRGSLFNFFLFDNYNACCWFSPGTESAVLGKSMFEIVWIIWLNEFLWDFHFKTIEINFGSLRLCNRHSHTCSSHGNAILAFEAHFLLFSRNQIRCRRTLPHVKSYCRPHTSTWDFGFVSFSLHLSISGSFVSFDSTLSQSEKQRE